MGDGSDGERRGSTGAMGAKGDERYGGNGGHEVRNLRQPPPGNHHTWALQMKISRFEDLVAWQRARSMVSSVYAHVHDGHARRDYAYRDQLCRAAISSMTNIAEGFGRRSKYELARFLDIARASAREVQSLLYVGLDLGYLAQEDFDRLYTEARQTSYLISRLLATTPSTKSDRHETA